MRYLLILALAGCASVPQQQVVSEVKTLPPVSVAVPVRCVDTVPPAPTLAINPNATVLQRYYQMRALIDAQDAYIIQANALLQACATVVNVPSKGTTNGK